MDKNYYLNKIAKLWYAEDGVATHMSIRNLIHAINNCSSYIENGDELLERDVKYELQSILDSKMTKILQEDSFKTPDNRKLFAIYQLKSGKNAQRLFAIVNDLDGYAIGCGYAPEEGYWDQGIYYGFQSVQDAADYIRNEYGPTMLIYRKGE